MKTLWLGLTPLFVSLFACLPDILPNNESREYTPVYLLGVEHLTPPPVSGMTGKYRLGKYVAIDPDAAEAGQAAAFLVSVAAAADKAVSMRWHGAGAASCVDVVAVQLPEESRSAALAKSYAPQSARSHLLAGKPTCWLASAGPDAGGLERRFGVTVPAELCRRPAVLEIFTDTTPAGAPLAPARVELAPDWFYIGVIGDSVLWGNGLPEEDKISTLVAAGIEARTGRRAIVQRMAQSAARIIPQPGDDVCEAGCSGEVPLVSTSITWQAELLENPAQLDLVLLDGCVNDLGLLYIMDPATPADELAWTSEFLCGHEMLALLLHVRERAPQAAIVVTGYYPFVSDQSDLLGISAWLQTLGQEVVPEGVALRNVLAEHSQTFVDAAHRGLRAAVAHATAANDGGPASRIAFVDPGFGPENALFAPNSWLWNLTSRNLDIPGLEQDLHVFPEDPMHGFRLEWCFEPQVRSTIIECLYASVAHPNPCGAWAYAAQVLRRLEELEVLPPEPPQ